jgi:hypothetical protein
MRYTAFAVLLGLTLSSPGKAQDVPSDVSFSISRAYLQRLMTEGPGGRTVGARFQTQLRMGDHSRVHRLDSDCELHVAGVFGGGPAADPGGLVVEPPNVCKLRVPPLPASGALSSEWEDLFSNEVTGHDCTVTGFPRIFTEHAQGGEAGSSNPDHVLEIHPATEIDCGATRLNFVPSIRVFPGMRKISDGSAVACLGERDLFVRERGDGPGAMYDFHEEGGMGAAGRCGNFVVVEAHVTREFIRQLDNGGDHVALARAWIGDSGPFPLKIYTYAGTDIDRDLAALLNNPDPQAALEHTVHGVLTYDYFTIAQVLQEPDPPHAWLPQARLSSFTEIRNPLSLVVFGRAASSAGAGGTGSGRGTHSHHGSMHRP